MRLFSNFLLTESNYEKKINHIQLLYSFTIKLNVHPALTMRSDDFFDSFCFQINPQKNATLPYFGNFWIDFYNFYMPIHKVIAIIIINFGLITNFSLMKVLSRKNMSSPSNTFLIGISIADTIVLVVYIFAWIFFIAFDRLTYEWTLWFIASMGPYCLFRSISSWATVFLALWRVISLYFPMQKKMKLNERNAIITLIVIYSVCVISYIPFSTNYYVGNRNCLVNGSTTVIYHVSIIM